MSTGGKMAEELNMAIKGLYTHPDVLSEAPKGSLVLADNVVIDREGIASSRRGFDLYAQTLNVPGGYRQLFFYRDRLFAHTTYTGSPYGGILYRDDNEVITEVGSIDPPDITSTTTGFKIRGVESNRNLYLSSSEGIIKLDSPTGSLVSAGMPKGLSGSGTPTGTSGFLEDNTAVAYRVVWGIDDANKNRILGAPSQRIIVINTEGGSRDVELTFVIPDGITTSHFYQLYRSTASSTAADEPNDELQLVYENNPTAGEISVEEITFTDNLPYDLMRATIYTAPSQQGISQANEPPPFCHDMTTYKNHTFYGNTRQKHRKTLTLIGVAGTGSPIGGGINIGDTITIAGTTYTGAAAENAALDQFFVDQSGTPAENIDATARSLVNVINKSTTNTSVYAHYITGFEELPGQMLIEERGFGGDEYYLTSSNGDAFDPVLPTSGTSVASDNEEAQNRLYYSKVQQPEAVPLSNFFPIGSADQPIIRVLALRESVFIFKRDGVFRLIGESSVNFRVVTADSTTNIKGPETAVVVNNQITLMSDQGVVTVSENGDIAILSRPIEKDLLAIEQYQRFNIASFAIAYESDRKYILFLPNEDTAAAKINNGYVYNTITKSWTKWNIHGFLEDLDNPGKYTPNTELSFGSGVVHFNNDRLYLATWNEAGNNNIWLKERKTFTREDMVDTLITQNVHSVPDDTTIVLETYIGPNVGDADDLLVNFTIEQNSLREVITGNQDQLIDGSYRTVITVSDTTSGYDPEGSPIGSPIPTVNLLAPITSRIQWVPQHAGNPGKLKHWQEILLFFDVAEFDNVSVSFETDFGIAEAPLEILLMPINIGGIGWGSFVWGNVPWGSQGVLTQETLRTYFDRQSRRAHWVGIKVGTAQAKTRFDLSGVQIKYKATDTQF